MKTHDYFQSYQDYFWRYEEDHKVFTFEYGGSTIAYKDYVIEILEYLSHQGLPSLGSVLLAIIATNPKGDKAVGNLKNLELSRTFYESNSTYQDSLALQKTQKDAIAFLRKLHNIPDEFKTGKNRLILFQTLFEKSHYHLALYASKKIVSEAKSGLIDKELLNSGRKPTKSEMQFDLVWFTFLNEKFKTPDDIVKAMANVPELKQIIELQDPEILKEKLHKKDDTEKFIEDLESNPDTYQIGSLIKSIWSGLNIPVHSILPSEQPLGGISDITNKGDLDKLLISEFANDDILFMSRLANNEALYHQREVPPQNNPMHRALLIDCSIRNWGTPKIVSLATAIAIARHPKTDIACHVFVIGKKCESAFIHTVNDVILAQRHNSILQEAEFGLEDFFAKFSAKKNTEVFILSEKTAIVRPGMQRAIGKFSHKINYIISTDEEGGIDVYKKNKSGNRHIQHLKIDLQENWNKKRPVTKKPEPKASNHSATNLPILVATEAGHYPPLFDESGELYSIMAKYSLLQAVERKHHNYNLGWNILYDNLPAVHRESQFAIGKNKNDEKILLNFNPHNKDLYLINLKNSSEIKIEFKQWQLKSEPMGFHFYQGDFYHINYLGNWQISTEGIVQNTEDPNLKTAIEKSISNHFKTYSSSFSIFRKIERVYINTQKKLVFNIHELNSGASMHLTKTNENNKFIEAKRDYSYLSKKKNQNHDRQFNFPDGSKIKIHPVGIIILVSSDPSIPDIYIPSVTETAIAAATEDYFCGSEIFQKKSRFSLRLIDAGQNSEKLINIIRQKLYWSHEQIQYTVENPPGTIASTTKKKFVTDLLEELQATGARCQLLQDDSFQPANPNQQQISVLQFFDKYINRFIQHILDHGA